MYQLRSLRGVATVTAYTHRIVMEDVMNCFKRIPVSFGNVDQ